ncbi:hypothetical protein RINTU1_33030 [Candidatus Regiella insecticola]|uniref:Uncharacterized protein n=1 Tax=Candidatus Regiella insecticola TaxID=138073 RepID=A0A6L2ZSH3_9ENTR|nr:hypothetical protein RINTU1_33030 [Candidatus Regiella insecticola]
MPQKRSVFIKQQVYRSKYLKPNALSLNGSSNLTTEKPNNKIYTHS